MISLLLILATWTPMPTNAPAAPQRPLPPLWTRPDVEIDLPNPALRWPKVVCFSESCRGLVPIVRQMAAADGYRSACVVRVESGVVMGDAFTWSTETFELHARTFWPEALVVYVIGAEDDDED